MYERCHPAGQVHELLRPSGELRISSAAAGEPGERPLLSREKSQAGVEKVEVRGWARGEICMRGVTQVARCLRC